jgi:putative sigma-54 modulation protein
MKVKIQSVHFDADQKLIDFIESKVEKLTTYFDRIIDCNVTLSLDNKKTQIKDKVAVVKVQIPGNILIGKDSSKLFEESVDLAIDSIRRQLKRHKEKMRAKV